MPWQYPHLAVLYFCLSSHPMRDQLVGRQTSDQGGNRAYLNFFVNRVPQSGIARLQRSSFQTQNAFSSLIG